MTSSKSRHYNNNAAVKKKVHVNTSLKMDFTKEKSNS